jgi:hypothetical protein
MGDVVSPTGLVNRMGRRGEGPNEEKKKKSAKNCPTNNFY